MYSQRSKFVSGDMQADVALVHLIRLIFIHEVVRHSIESGLLVSQQCETEQY